MMSVHPASYRNGQRKKQNKKNQLLYSFECEFTEHLILFVFCIPFDWQELIFEVDWAMQGVPFPAARRLCCCCSSQVIQRRLAPLTFARSYAAVTGCAQQVQQPLNLVAGRRVDPDNQSKHFDLVAPATGLDLLFKIWKKIVFLLLKNRNKLRTGDIYVWFALS